MFDANPNTNDGGGLT